MKIAIGADHAGYDLKQEVLECIRHLGYECEDVGTYSAEAIDYPDIASRVATMVTQGKAERGIVFCGTGIGVSIAANKVKGIRAALCHDTFSAQASREHNNANVLCMGGRVIGAGLACAIAKIWLESPFSQGERHVRRIDKIGALER